jgi:ParB family chromosome partitioning protein
MSEHRILRVRQVEPDPAQPRKLFDAKALEELSASIRANGLLQPITVRLVEPDIDGDPFGPGARFVIVAGERRWRAHQLAGMVEIACNVHTEMTDDQQAVAAIVENLQRADITPLEEARAFQRMLDTGYTPETLAHRLGVKQPHRISDRIQLLKLRAELLSLFEKGHLSPSQAFEMSRLGPAGQSALFGMVKRGACDTYAKLRAAADGLVQAEQQASMFELPPAPTDDERATLTRFERMVERLTEVCSQGIRDNEVVILKKVAPGRAAVIVQQLGLIRADLARMERALQQAAAQGELAA